MADYLISRHSVFLSEIKQRTPYALLMLQTLLEPIIEDHDFPHSK